MELEHLRHLLNSVTLLCSNFFKYLLINTVKIVFNRIHLKISPEKIQTIWHNFSRKYNYIFNKIKCVSFC